jgi:hypothetical protein
MVLKRLMRVSRHQASPRASDKGKIPMYVTGQKVMCLESGDFTVIYKVGKVTFIPDVQGNGSHRKFLKMGAYDSFGITDDGQNDG